MNKKKMVCTVLMAGIMVFMLGCQKTETNKKMEVTYEIEEVDNIVLESNSSSVLLKSGESEKIKVILQGMKESEVATNIKLEGKELNIYVPDQSGIIHIDGCTAVIEIPKSYIKNMQVKTELGTVTCEGINADIKAITELSEIKTDLPIGSDITIGKNGVGNEVEGVIGKNTESPMELLVESNSGDIIIK